MNLAETKTQRATLVAQMRTILKKAEDEKRGTDAAEDETYRKTEAEVDRLGDLIAAEETRASRADKLKTLEADLDKSPAPKAKPTPEGGSSQKRGDARATPEYSEAFCAALRGDFYGAQAAFAKLPAELRTDTLQVGLTTKGGYLQAPQQFVAELLKNVDNALFVRQYARKFSLTQAESLGVVTLDTDFVDADWTVELATGNQDDLTFGKRELRPHPIAKRVKVSKTLKRVSAIPIDALIRERMEYAFRVTFEKAYLTGSGLQRPLGIFTASADGIPTTRDISTQNTTSEITADGLINAKHFMKAAYWPSARWVFHRDGIKLVRKLKDGNGQYLWEPGIASGGMPDSILGLPYDLSEYAPNTFTTGLYVGALAAWPFYWIADALDFEVQYLDQLYAEQNTDGYIGRMESDGAPVLAEAFVRVKLA
jgi:HK97 family phage major capsid protein